MEGEPSLVLGGANCEGSSRGLGELVGSGVMGEHHPGSEIRTADHRLAG